MPLDSLNLFDKEHQVNFHSLKRKGNLFKILKSFLLIYSLFLNLPPHINMCLRDVGIVFSKHRKVLGL